MSQKTKNHSNILPVCWDSTTGALTLSFGMMGDISDVIKHAKFCFSHFSLQQSMHYCATLWLLLLYK